MSNNIKCKHKYNIYLVFTPVNYINIIRNFVSLIRNKRIYCKINNAQQHLCLNNLFFVIILSPIKTDYNDEYLDLGPQNCINVSSFLMGLNVLI